MSQLHDMHTRPRPASCTRQQQACSKLVPSTSSHVLPCLQGRKRFKLYQQLVAFAFALVQAAGQELYLKPYVPEYSATWFAVSLAILSGGAMVLVKVHPCALQSWLSWYAEMFQQAAGRARGAQRSGSAEHTSLVLHQIKAMTIMQLHDYSHGRLTLLRRQAAAACIRDEKIWAQAHSRAPGLLLTAVLHAADSRRPG